MADAARFLTDVLRNPAVAEILEHAPALDLPDWMLVGGALFQTVWNVLDGRDPAAGIDDHDVFYLDPDTSYAAEDAHIRRAAATFTAPVELRNQARVHLWYEQRFGRPGVEFTSTRMAVDHFAGTTCCFGVTRPAGGQPQVYAPHGFADLYAQRMRPNPVLAPRAVYEAKTRRWKQEWPDLVVEPWPR